MRRYLAVGLVFVTLATIAALMVFGPLTMAQKPAALPSTNPDSSSVGASVEAPPPPRPDPNYLWQMYSGVDFKPIDSSYGYDYVSGAGISSNYAGGAWFYAHVLLPAGAEIRQIKYYYVDNTDSASLSLDSKYYDPATANDTYISNEGTDGLSSSATIRTLTWSGTQAVDNSKYSYELIAYFSTGNAGLQLIGARVGYTVPGMFIPLTQK